MNKEPELIDINEWECFGGGYTADSYYHKTDKTIMLKLFAPFMPPIVAYKELTMSEVILTCGIEIPKPIKYVVTKDGKYGAIFERLQNKVSFARYVADHPDEAEKIGKVFGEEGKKFHSAECNTIVFKDAQTVYPEYIERVDWLTQKQRENALNVVKNTPKATTCLHGDFHLGNLLIVNNRNLFIDLGDFKYGNPLYDLGVFYFVTHESSEERCQDMFHTSLDVVQRFFDAAMTVYYPGKAKEEIVKIIKPYSGLCAIFFAQLTGRKESTLERVIGECFGKE